MFFFTNHTANALPHKQFLQSIRHFYNDHHFYLVWINLSDNADNITLKDVLKNKTLKLICHFDDGAIYITNDGGK